MWHGTTSLVAGFRCVQCDELDNGWRRIYGAGDYYVTLHMEFDLRDGELLGATYEPYYLDPGLGERLWSD